MTPDNDEPEFHDTVKLLLARMDSNPDDFIPQGVPNNSNRQNFRHFVEVAQQYLTGAEKAALKQKLREVGLMHIHKQIMRAILNGEKPV